MTSSVYNEDEVNRRLLTQDIQIKLLTKKLEDGKIRKGKQNKLEVNDIIFIEEKYSLPNMGILLDEENKHPLVEFNEKEFLTVAFLCLFYRDGKKIPTTILKETGKFATKTSDEQFVLPSSLTG